MNFKQETLAERVILKPFIEQVSKGGIHLARDPRSQAISTDKGEVVMVGPAAWWDIPKDVRPKLYPGDKVYYAKYGAKTFRNEDQPDPNAPDAYFVMCNDKDILVGYE